MTTPPTSSGGRRGQLASSGLRSGWTTGACATAAARAAYAALLCGEFPDPVQVTLPLGRNPEFALTFHEISRDESGRPMAWMAAVTKDAGDDPDVTHGAVVRATVRPLSPGSGLTFLAGPGVGTVTAPGLPLPVGEPAINPVPRRLIRENLEALTGDAPLDLSIEISIDGGAELARHTWNPRIGIIGGLSVLGTTGVVVPYSCSAWIDSIRLGIDVAVATGQRHVAAATGSTSERVVQDLYGLPDVALLDMGDFAGAVLKYLRRHPLPRLTICGGFAKIAKLAAGHLDLHSSRSILDHAQLAALARSAGADDAVCEAIAVASTGLQALQIATEAGIGLGDAVAAAAQAQAMQILQGVGTSVDVICIDRAGLVVGRSQSG
ncbi:MAG: cobalt-precorrin-5B (C(1))-methyltransferase [Candidatus Nanopelagicales bacterium]